jgi:L-alanine-DL-glutamate epimerase-like enolase superfamily enzyme
MSASLCAVLPNVRIMEIDIDDVPWKDELTTAVPENKYGYMTIPAGPGWGTENNEELARAHPWEVAKGGYSKTVPPPKSF